MVIQGPFVGKFFRISNEMKFPRLVANTTKFFFLYTLLS